MPESGKTVLCPTDFSDPSRTAYQTALQMAAALGARLVLLNVVRPLPHGPHYGDLDVPGFMDRAAKNARKKLEEMAAEAGDVQVEFDVRQGEPHEQIVAAAKEIAPDMLVISTHGRKGIQKLVFGSVTEKVLRLVECPVLTVHMKKDEE